MTEICRKPHITKFESHLLNMSPGDSTSYWDFAEHFDDELEGFEVAMSLLADGQPIYFST